jgi:hypothetical protein
MVSFTPAEFAELQEAAGEEPVASYVRRVVLRVLTRRRRK